MRLQYRLFKVFLIISALLLISYMFIGVIFLKNSQNSCYSLIINTIISLFTGSVIVCTQSCIGYFDKKRYAILNFYKETCLLEEAINTYPYEQTGFIAPDNGLKDIRKIVIRMFDSFKMAYSNVYVGKNPDKTLSAVKDLFNVYSEQIKPYQEFKNILLKAIEFKSKSNDELVLDEINIKDENDRLNDELRKGQEKIISSFNDKAILERIHKDNSEIEKYLYINSK